MSILHVVTRISVLQAISMSYYLKSAIRMNVWSQIVKIILNSKYLLSEDIYCWIFVWNSV